MTWPTWYLSLWDALVETIKTVSDVNKERVFYGERFPPDDYPSIYVCPLPIDLAPASTAETLNAVRFDIGVVVKSADAKEGAKDALTLVGNIQDKLIADRTLGGKCSCLEVIQIAPNWRRLNRGMETFWSGLIIEITEVI
jgi:hypothetical protein